MGIAWPRARAWWSDRRTSRQRQPWLVQSISGLRRCMCQAMRTTLTPVLALSKRNSNAAEIILFLHRLCSVRQAREGYLVELTGRF